MDDTLRLLHSALGAPGSARVRYGAAMQLFRRGALSEAQLDVYRDASPHDALDPALLLHQRRLPPVPALVVSPTEAIAGLFDAARDYLNGLSHPGAAEVRAGFGRCADEAKPVATKPNAVVSRWLDPALAAAAQHAPRLAAAIGAAAPHLAWITYDLYPRAEIGDSFAEGHAFAPIAGGDAPFAAESFELGVFLIAPHVLYRDHCHPAPELYAPLTGPHGWRFAPGRSLIVKEAGAPVWNPPLQHHLTKVGAVPFLCLFAWTRDVNLPARVIPAGDWSLLEALRIASPGGQP